MLLVLWYQIFSSSSSSIAWYACIYICTYYYCCYSTRRLFNDARSDAFFFFVFSSSSSSCGWLKCEKLWESAFLFSTPSDNPFSHSHYPFWNLASALSERNKTITSTTQYRSHFSPLSLSLLSITIDFSPCRSTVTNVAINESNDDDDDDASCTWHW